MSRSASPPSAVLPPPVFITVPFTVIVAETTLTRSRLSQAIILRSAAWLLSMIGGTAIIVWIAVTISFRLLYRLSKAIAEPSPNDLHPIR